MDEVPATQYATDYGAGIAQAIALAAQPPPAGAPLPQWHFLGPDMVPNGQVWSKTSRPVTVSGRVGAIAVDPSDKNHLLCGSAAGGIWESFTRGASWAPRTDSMLTLTVGAIAFDPNSTKTVYAGTGEGNSYSTLGQGVLRSTDGGTTWSLLTQGPFLGLGFFRIIVDPANSRRLLAATTGGLFQSADAGATWTQAITAETWDVSLQAAGGPTAEVLAATANGVQSSADGGQTWTVQTLPGAPASWTRIAACIAPSDGTVAFAFGASTDSTPVPYLWQRSNSTWSAVALPKGLDGSQAFYAWFVAVSPGNSGQVYIGAFDIDRGDLAAGTWTWTNITSKADTTDSIHPDQHTIVFDPSDATNATIYAGCDGGIFRSPDRGVSWVSLNPGLGITEVEYMASDNNVSRWLLAGTQDNGSMRYLGTSTFDCVTGGDGGDCGVDQNNPDTCYNTYYNMSLGRSPTKGTRDSFVDITPPIPTGYVSLFYPPVGVSGPTIAEAGTSVWISRDSGANWTEVTLPPDPKGASQKATALSVPTTDLIYAAMQNGRLFKITYSSGAWSSPAELTSPRPLAYISSIRADPSPGGRIWVTSSWIWGGTVFRSDDGGTTWSDKSAGLPAIPINSVIVDPSTADRVWVSGDVGVYKSEDGGGTWSAFSLGLPNVLAEDLEFHPVARLLRAATRSRGVWEVKVDQPGSSAPPQGLQASAVLWNHNGGLEVFGAGTDKVLWHRYQNAPSTLWEPWGSLGSGTFVTSALAAASNDDQRMEVFGRGPDGLLYHIYQTAPDFGWSGWAALGGVITGNPAVANNVGPSRLEVFARGSDGTLWHTYQSAPGDWTGAASRWSSLGQVITSTAAAILNATGGMSVFARGIDGALWHSYQTKPGDSTSWSSWQSLGGDLAGKPTVRLNQGGCMNVFARGTDGALRRIYQTSISSSDQPAGSWSTWESLTATGSLAGDPAAARNPDWRLEVFARGTDNALWHIYQNTPTSDWSSWSSLGGTITSDPTAWTIQAGGLVVFAQGTDTSLWHLHQIYASSSTVWSPWGQVGGSPQPLLAFP